MRSSLSFLVSCASCLVVVFVGGFYVSRASESSFRNDGLRWSLTISCRRLGLSSSWLVVVGVCVHARASWLVRPNDVARVSDDPLLPTEISHAWPFPSRSSFKLSNETDMRSMSWRRGSIPPPRMGALEDLFPPHRPFHSERDRERHRWDGIDEGERGGVDHTGEGDLFLIPSRVLHQCRSRWKTWPHHHPRGDKRETLPSSPFAAPVPLGWIPTHLQLPPHHNGTPHDTIQTDVVRRPRDETRRIDGRTPSMRACRPNPTPCDGQEPCMGTWNVRRRIRRR